MKENIEKMLAWLEADHALRGVSKGRKAWLTKSIGISGHN